MAIGPDDFGAYQVTGDAGKLALAAPKEPLWALIPAVALQGIDSVPAAAKAYVPALQGAEQIVFSMSADRDSQLAARAARHLQRSSGSFGVAHAA